MNWYSLLKLSSPIGAIMCPNCGKKMIVDANQVLGTLNSSAYGRSGDAYTNCLKCQETIHFQWTDGVANIASISNISIVQADMNNKIVESVEASDSEYEDIFEIANSHSNLQPIDMV